MFRSTSIYRSIFIYCFVFIALALSANISFADDSKPTTIGIVVPIEHQALNEIISGFKDTLTKETNGKITFVIKNAQGDTNLQREILQEFKQDRQIDLIAAVTTSTLQMALAAITDKPIVGIAAAYTEQQRAQRVRKNVTNVDDEIDAARQIEFIHKVVPNVRKITLLYSPTDKIMPEVKTFSAAASAYNIQVQQLMIPQLSDLYTISTHMAKDSQALFVLKDNLIASGINTLVKIADKKHAPLITSDNGTVEQGAVFALGVKEYQIGVEGAYLAAQVLRGADISKLPMKKMDKLFVFVNPDALKKQGQELTFSNIKTASNQLRYTLVLLKNKGGK